MVKRPADALGMTVVWFALTSPVLYAFWLTLSEPRYERIGFILPLVIAFGAPIAYVVTGFVGPRLGRQVSAFFSQHRHHANPSSPEQVSGESTSVSRSVTITPRTGSLKLGLNAPKVLVYAADNLAVRVQETLSLTCNVTLTVNPTDAITHIRTGTPIRVILDSSLIRSDMDEVFRAAREAVGIERVYVLNNIRFQSDALSGWELTRKYRVRVVEPKQLEALAAEFGEVGWKL